MHTYHSATCAATFSRALLVLLLKYNGPATCWMQSGLPGQFHASI
jgi:hypothetical protein